MAATPVADTGERLADRGWVDVQKKTFTNWVNDRLKDTGRKVDNLETDLEDGVTLIKLLEALVPGKKMPGRYNMKPRMLIQKRQNLTIAFNFMTKVEKIPLVNIDPGDILEHNLKLILGLVWALILRYQIATTGPSEEGSESKVPQKKVSAKKLLLGWVNASLPDHDIKNFTSNWNDGRNLSGLVDYCKPGLIPNHASLNPNNALGNITNAMNLAEEHFGIPQVMAPKDLAVEKPDELSVMTYLSYFCCSDSVGQNALLAWIQSKIPKQNVTNFTTDWTDGKSLGALTDVISGGGFPEYEEMNPKNAVENCKEGLDAAERLLDVQQTIEPKQFSDPNLDQLTQMAYLTQFRYAKATQSPAGKLKAVGPGITGDVSGKETNFLVRGRVPEWTKLNVAVLTPTGEKVPTKHHATSAKATSYQYTPVVPGTYTVSIKLDNEHIPGSPFQVSHTAPSNAERCKASGTGLDKAHVGETSQFSVNCKEGGTGDLQVDIIGPKGSIRSEVTEPSDQDYAVKFTPLEAGPHTISVLWDGKHIANSPFTCLVTDPKKVHASGSGLTGATVGELQHFTVKADKAGPGKVSGETTSPSGSRTPIQVRDDGKGNYVCTYTPKEKGEHHIDVWWSDSPISGSPFKVNAVEPANASKCSVSDLPTGKLRAGKPYQFTVDASQAGSAELKASALGPSVPEKCEVVDNGDGTYAVKFTPEEVGKVKVNVTYGDALIPRCPLEFTVNDPSKCKVNAAAIAKGSYSEKQPIDFRVSAQFAGEGDLTATARGPKGAEALQVKDQGGHNYLVHYTPTEGGPHAIDIQFDGEQIPDVPIRIFVESGSNADNVIVTQPAPGRLGEFVVQHPYEYKVNTAGAGEANLTATSHGARTGLKPKLDVVDDGNGQYRVVLNAREPDDYHVSIMWGEEHVPGSPFKLPVEDKPRPDRVVCSGPYYKVGSSNPVTLDVDTAKAGAGELSATCYSDKGGSVPVEIKEKEPKKYTVSFVPPGIDVYSLSVLWSQENVKDSPFKVNLIPPDAEKCIVTGPEIPLEAYQPVKLRVDASNAGNGKLAAKAVGINKGPADVDIEEVEPNVFDISFVPPGPDTYDFDVTWGDKPIPGAPFKLDLRPARADEVVIAEAPRAMLEAGQSIGICFDTSKAGRGELTATCKGSRVGDIPVKVSERSKDKYDINFSPPEPDVYQVTVMWGGKQVKGSPFTINLMPVDVNKVRVIGPSQHQGLEGPVEVMLQTKGAGKGKVTAACLNSKGEDVDVTIAETSADIYQLSFKPPKPDLYTFAVQYGGQNVNGSPFRINTLPPDASKVRVTEPEEFELSQPLTYICDTLYAGAGKLTATCRGEKYGAVHVDVKEDGLGKYKVFFTPHHPDVYNLSIQWSGEEVPGSPFRINLLPPNANKVKVGDLHIPEEAGTEEPVWVDLDCSDAGHGQVTGKARGDLVGELPVEIEKRGRDKYRAKFYPTGADNYHFDVYYGDKNVPGSPFDINLVPPQPDLVKLTGTSLPEEAGAPIALSFNTKEAGRGSLSAKARGKSVGNVPVDIKETSPNNFDVTFVPPKPDAYDIDVFWADKPVKDSPFSVDTRPAVHPELVECGEPIFTEAGKPVDLAVDATKAGPGTLTAKCSSELCGEVPVQVEATSPHTYNVSFIPLKEDDYNLQVFYDGVEVQDSPFSVDLRPQKPIMEEMMMRPVEDIVESMFIPAEFVQGAPPPGRESPVDELTNYVGEPTMLTIEPESEEQKSGELKAIATGDKTGPADIKVSRNPDGTFDVYFNPDKPDRYKIDVKLNGEHVPSSPFYINYVLRSDPSKCYIFGLEDIPAVPQVGEKIKFGVDAREAGQGKLAVTADGPSCDNAPSNLEVTPSDEDPRIYEVTYVPTASGLHRVHLQWANEAIPGSPLGFQIGDASAIQTYPYGQPVAMDVTADCKQGDLEAYAIHEDTNTRLKVKTSKAEKGKFKLGFNPKDPGIYAVHVLKKKKEIPGSPYRIRIAEPPNPAACRVTGLDDKGFVGEPVNFSVDVSEAGSGDLHMKATGPTPEEEADFTVSDNKDGTYSATYIPNAPGDHQFDITWAGKPIPGSPFHVSVSERKATIKKPLEGNGTINLAEVGQPIEIHISDLAKEVDEDYLTAQCIGKNSGEAEVAIDKEDDGSYVIRFTPTVADDYTLSVKMNKDDIEGSPFFIKAVEKGDLSPDFAHPGGICHSDVEAGQPVNLLVKVEEAKVADDLFVSNKGPSGPCETKVNDEVEGTFGLEFTPELPGDYLIDAKEDDVEVPGGPFKIRAVGKPDASKVHISEEDMHLFSKPLPFGRPARFRISTRDAGRGTLNITSRGPGKAEVKVFDNKDGTYTCEFHPTIAGKYHIDILWNDEHIKDSPYTLNFKSKKSRVITGLNLENENFRISVPHRFKLHTDEIGQGVLEIICKPANAAKIRLIALATTGSYQCEILPEEVGNHEISVQYNGKHIFGSPFSVQFELRGDATKCRMIDSSVEHQQEMDDNVSFSVSTEGAGNGKLTASVEKSATQEKVPVTVIKTEADLYNVEFNPGDGAEYLLTIKYDEQHILGSPFKLVFGPPNTDASQCHAEGDGIISTQVEKWGKFTVFTENAGPGELVVEIESEGEKITPQISSISETEYEVSYLPLKPGMYSVSVLWGQAAIPGSPFEVRCYQPADPTLLSIPEPVTEVMLGNPVEFLVKAAGKLSETGELTVVLQSSHNQNIHGKVRRDKDGNFLCTIDPPAAAGKYMIHVRWNGEHINKSPIKLKVMTPPKPEKVRAYGPGLENGIIGQEGNFTVETGEGGAGTLAVRVHGPKGAFKINMRRHPDNERTILVRYDPNHVGVYTVDITWSDTHIPGSPFKIDIAEQPKRK